MVDECSELTNIWSQRIFGVDEYSGSTNICHLIWLTNVRSRQIFGVDEYLGLTNIRHFIWSTNVRVDKLSVDELSVDEFTGRRNHVAPLSLQIVHAGKVSLLFRPLAPFLSVTLLEPILRLLTLRLQR
jgi:hypothetical protein